MPATRKCPDLQRPSQWPRHPPVPNRHHLQFPVKNFRLQAPRFQRLEKKVKKKYAESLREWNSCVLLHPHSRQGSYTFTGKKIGRNLKKDLRDRDKVFIFATRKTMDLRKFLRLWRNLKNNSQKTCRNEKELYFCTRFERETRGEKIEDTFIDILN